MPALQICRGCGVLSYFAAAYVQGRVLLQNKRLRFSGNIDETRFPVLGGIAFFLRSRRYRCLGMTAGRYEIFYFAYARQDKDQKGGKQASEGQYAVWASHKKNQNCCMSTRCL
mgnify:FL=1